MSVSIVIVGHIDHGKSTLIGRLLYDSDNIPQEKMAEVQKLFEEYKKRFEFAYFLDSFEEEMKEERTIDTTRVLFKGKDYYTVVDVPGHKEFIKNMLTGASHAQVAVMVVAAPNGVEEQTRRHAFLLKMLGIKQVIGVINKMDLMDYSQETFEKVKEWTTELFDSLGYSDIPFIPISSTEGDNVYKRSQRMDWYTGPTFIEALDAIEPVPVTERALRFAVQDVYQVDGDKVTVGRVDSGVLKKGDELVFQPSGVKGKVQRIKVYPDEIEEARAGDSVGIVIDCDVPRGNIGGHPDSPPVTTDRFLGEVVLLEGTLKQGDEFEIKCGPKRAKCRVEQMKTMISSETGEALGRKAEEIGQHEAATAVFDAEPLVVEKFSEIPELGRFILVSRGKNIGAGIVLEVKA